MRELVFASAVALIESPPRQAREMALRSRTRYATISAAGKKTRLKRKKPKKLCPFRAATRAGQKAIAIQMRKKTIDPNHQPSISAASHPGLRLCEPGLELFRACAVEVCHGLLDRVGERLVDGVGAAGVVDGDHAARAVRQRGVHLLGDPALEPVLCELPDGRAGDCPDRGRGQKRRREEPDDQADASAELGSLAAEVVTGLLDGHLALFVLLDEDDALDRDRLVLGEPEDRV